MHNICSDCSKDFTTRTGLIQHYLQSPRHHYCQRCDRHFDSQHYLVTHLERAHYYCHPCNAIFESSLGLEDHNRQKHWYCISCKRVFQSESNLNSHLRSSVHQPSAYACPGRNCGMTFISHAALILHWESGACPSGVTREGVDRVAVRIDRGGIITNPARLIRGPDGQTTAPSSTSVETWATERSWNGSSYECFLCHRTYRTLHALNMHLRSPAHADRIYRCPAAWRGCGREFRTLSALCQHVESEQCSVHRFSNEMQTVIDTFSSNLRIAY
ncbi:hypothetical protein SCP_1000120 [Sparassis crispa]|uniref:C2H2-type domain-containing protein n=1 Tax=Sparassis crispa TaxID=139825 RepID=A0A401GX58_9APHY|nr:hypothetical protein SCP_1000120 [Sparassis crispa]GBE86770.1 hypothetical protein SCP_1000120 [Sparassis crispa]